ncbi:molybdate ABC transporter permease subunit [Bacillus sp. AFS017336]|uniref:molybdate ABC transporter permease subunit n=1 Tax=Bacillus sp. AFS017336 TaxID=2033489 RepID=UPI000BEF60F8|nr:molybdate ABC transporter permease subunit [Bacillus sp. AFS017336]PEK99748.1 molybdate ABC transporter permease subunit [Bacillus sp. AFS017336]
MLEEFLIPLKISLKVTIVSGILVIILGTIAGRILSMKSFKGKTLLETVLMLPLVLPPTVVGFLLLVIFGRQSFLGKMIEWFFKQPIVFTWWAAVIASIIVAFPLMYQSAKTGFQSVDNEIEEAARVCGASEWKVFFFISIPLSFKAIISGSILSVARVLGEFGATLMFAGNIPGKTQTVPTAIYLAIDSGNMKMAWLWVLSMVFISFIMLLVVQLKQK